MSAWQQVLPRLETVRSLYNLKSPLITTRSCALQARARHSILLSMNGSLETLFPSERPFSLRSIRLPSSLAVLFLGPHPDDFDAVGVTMRLLKENGNRLDVGVVRTGSGVEDGYCSPPTPEVKAATREQEQRRSCSFFGLPDASLTFLHLEEDDEAHPTENPINVRHIQEFVLSKRPDIVLLPHGNDTNAGHQRMYAMFKRIASSADYPLAAFLNRDPKTVNLRIDLYTEFSEDDAIWKAKLLRFHDSQHQRNLNTRGVGFDDRILNTNRQIADEISPSAGYAEAFELELYGQPTR
jgi:LmbE family N-acetylglucosaminyl deacetylase